MRQIHLECTPDECLVRTLGQVRKNITHHNDKGRVCNYLQKNRNVVGMIDDDPGSAQPSYLRILSQVSDKHNIRVLEDSVRENKIVVISPRLEEWIIEICHINEIKMNSFGLSDRANWLHREINNKLHAFEKLLTHLISEKAPQILHLKTVIR